MRQGTIFILSLVSAPLLFASTLMAGTAIQRNMWKPEKLSGTIAMVDPAKKLLVVQGPDRVPFDIDLTARTRIRSGDRTITMKDLSDQLNKPVSVDFTPESRGDIANSIEIQD